MSKENQSRSATEAEESLLRDLAKMMLDNPEGVKVVLDDQNDAREGEFFDSLAESTSNTNTPPASSKLNLQSFLTVGAAYIASEVLSPLMAGAASIEKREPVGEVRTTPITTISTNSITSQVSTFFSTALTTIFSSPAPNSTAIPTSSSPTSAATSHPLTTVFVNATNATMRILNTTAAPSLSNNDDEPCGENNIYCWLPIIGVATVAAAVAAYLALRREDAKVYDMSHGDGVVGVPVADLAQQQRPGTNPAIRGGNAVDPLRAASRDFMDSTEI